MPLKISPQKHGFWKVTYEGKETLVSPTAMDRNTIFFNLNEIGCSPEQIDEVEETIAAKPENPLAGSKQFTPIRFDALRKMKYKRSFIVKDFLIPQTCVMAYGTPGCSKSLWSNDLALAVASGTPFLGMETKKQPVLIVDNENSLPSLQERTNALWEGRRKKMRAPKNLWVLSRIGSLDDQGAAKKVIALIQQEKVRLVIFDTFRRITSAEENSSTEINNFLTVLFQPIIDLGCTIIFLHHSQKGKNGYRGSSDLLGYVDAAFSVSKEKNKIWVCCEKSRTTEPDKISAEWDFTPGNYRLTRLDDVKEEQETVSRLKEVTEAIKGLFEKHQQLRRGEVCDLLDGSGKKMSLAAVKRSLKYLVRIEFLCVAQKGVYTKKGQQNIQKIQ